MSDRIKWELKLSAISIIFAIVTSLIATVWMASELAHQVDVNTKHLIKIDDRLSTIAKLIMKGKE